VVPNLHEVIAGDPHWSHSAEVAIDPKAPGSGPDPIRGQKLLFAGQAPQLNLLSRVLAAKQGAESMQSEEGALVDLGDDLVARGRRGGGPPGARRVAGSSLAMLSGGAGLTYVEYSTGGGSKVRAAEKAEKNKALRRRLGVA
jgi:hypothetical protein